MFGMVLIFVHTIFSYIKKIKKNSKFRKFFDFKKTVFLVLFATMPFLQLFVSFLGELIAEKLHPRLVLLFCFVYPLSMGGLQKLTSLINEKQDFNLEMLAEANSVFFASTPYKLVYLNVEQTWVALTILGIKVVYKLIAFLIVPWHKKKAQEINKHKVVHKGQEEGDNESSGVSINPGRRNQERRRSRRFSTIQTLVKGIFEEEDSYDQLFALKFFILQIFDFSSNIAIFLLVLTNELLIYKVMGYKYLEFSAQFVKNISIWTSVSPPYPLTK